MIIKNEVDATRAVINEYVKNKKVFSIVDVVNEVLIAFPDADMDKIVKEVHRFDLNRLDKNYEATFVKNEEMFIRVFHPAKTNVSNYKLNTEFVRNQLKNIGSNSAYLFNRNTVKKGNE